MDKKEGNADICKKEINLHVLKHSEYRLFTLISFASMLTQAADESSEEASFYEILPCCARFRCGEAIAEGQWHHLVLVMSKGMLKNSMATLYIDGQLINTVKVRLRVSNIIKAFLVTFQETVFNNIIYYIYCCYYHYQYYYSYDLKCLVSS